MKKIFLTLALGIATITFAQQGNPEMKKQNWEDRKVQMQEKQQKHLEKMKQDLNLSEVQVKQIKDLQDKEFADREANFKQKEAMRAEKMKEMKAKRDAHNAEMKKILSPEQYQKWEKQRDEKMQERKEMMKERGGKKGGVRAKKMPVDEMPLN